jgi:hypothetical protein
MANRTVTTYSVKFKPVPDETPYLELPVPKQGFIRHLVLYPEVLPITLSNAYVECQLVNRRGACRLGSDYGTQLFGLSGTVASIGGKARFFVGASSDLKLMPGDIIHVRGSENMAFNRYHTVLNYNPLTQAVTTTTPLYNDSIIGNLGMLMQTPTLPGHELLSVRCHRIYNVAQLNLSSQTEMHSITNGFGLPYVNADPTSPPNGPGLYLDIRTILDDPYDSGAIPEIYVKAVVETEY